MSLLVECYSHQVIVTSNKITFYWYFNQSIFEGKNLRNILTWLKTGFVAETDMSHKPDDVLLIIVCQINVSNPHI
jgi:hypothetical protein